MCRLISVSLAGHYIYLHLIFLSHFSHCLIYEPKYKFTYGQLCNPCGSSSYCVYGKIYDQLWIHKIYPQVAPLSFVWHSIVDVARLRKNNFSSYFILHQCSYYMLLLHFKSNFSIASELKSDFHFFHLAQRDAKKT